MKTFDFPNSPKNKTLLQAQLSKTLKILEQIPINISPTSLIGKIPPPMDNITPIYTSKQFTEILYISKNQEFILLQLNNPIGEEPKTTLSKKSSSFKIIMKQPILDPNFLILNDYRQVTRNQESNIFTLTLLRDRASGSIVESLKNGMSEYLVMHSSTTLYCFIIDKEGFSLLRK